MPVRISKRRRLLKKSKKKKKSKSSKSIFYLFIFLVGFFLIGYFWLAKDFWDGKHRLSLVINRNENGVLISTFDPEVGEIINIDIPGDTQVEVARNLGVWKLENVWKLAENEKLTGSLVAQTITRYFKFPVFAWADKGAAGLSEGGFISVIKAVITPYKTNLKIGDRLRIGLFSLRIANADRVHINLAETSYLKKTTLTDGSEGYAIVGRPSNKLTSIFADTDISSQEFKVVIRDATSETGLVEELGEVVEVLGAKVVSILKIQKQKIDCEVVGKDKEKTKKIARFFSCKVREQKLEGSLDLEITIGSQFAERF